MSHVGAEARRALDAGHYAALVKLDKALANRNVIKASKILDSLPLTGEQRIRVEDSLARAHGITSPSFFRNPSSRGPDGRVIPPDHYGGGYHGMSNRVVDINKIIHGKQGLPVRGPNTSLEDHALSGSLHGKEQSAFRGTTPLPVSPDGNSGAALWAGEGGWVFQVAGVPSWNVNKHLEHKIVRSGLRVSNPMRGETEYAVPGRIPVEKIVRYGRVSENKMTGRVQVKEWVSNPYFEGSSGE